MVMKINLVKKMYYEDKMTYKQIAEYFGYKSGKPIYRLFKKHNLVARNHYTKRINYSHSEETKAKIRNSNIGKTISEETRYKLRESHLGKIPWNKGKKGLQTAWNRGIKGSIKSNRTSFKKGCISWNKGKLCPQISEAKKGFKYSDESKLKMSNSAIRYIKEKGCKFPVRVGFYEKSILDVLENLFNYDILRQFQVGIHFIDGYCPALNLAIEIDEKLHRSKVKEDKIRENRIKKLINCNFLRIDIGEVI